MSWTLVGWAAGFAVVIVAVVTGALFGHGVGTIGFTVAVTISVFCLSGAFNVLWRWFWYLPRARRRARKDGVGSARFAAAMRGASPRNSSLIFQWAVGILAFALTLRTML